jgi:uncharacterized protein
MRTTTFIIFFSIVLVIYGSINYYIFKRGIQALPDITWLRISFITVFSILSLSYIIGRVLERVTLCDASDVLVHIGSLWLGMMAFFFFIVVFLDFTRLLNHFTGIYPAFINQNFSNVKFITFLSSVSLVIILTGYSYFNANNPKTETLNLSVNKKLDSSKTLKIAMASDIHLGTIIGKSRLDILVDRINSLNPDIILLAGDIVDEDLTPVIKQNLGESLRNFKSRYGTYAVLGNHEYIGGAERANKYLVEHGVTVLRDSVAKINNEFYLIGREDASLGQFSGGKRKTVDELCVNIDHTKPIILMDHQPFHLENSVKNKIDLQLSGHTHHGQIWPLNYITNMIYEISWGYKKIDNTHFYVSSGYGTWGPPMKLGNNSEIMNIVLNFE